MGATGIVVVGAVVTAAVVRAIDQLPIVPVFFKLIGAAYSAFFVWRYLVFEESRSELAENIQNILRKIK